MEPLMHGSHIFRRTNFPDFSRIFFTFSSTLVFYLMNLTHTVFWVKFPYFSSIFGQIPWLEKVFSFFQVFQSMWEPCWYPLFWTCVFVSLPRGFKSRVVLSSVFSLACGEPKSHIWCYTWLFHQKGWALYNSRLHVPKLLKQTYLLLNSIDCFSKSNNMISWSFIHVQLQITFNLKNGYKKVKVLIWYSKTCHPGPLLLQQKSGLTWQVVSE